MALTSGPLVMANGGSSLAAATSLPSTFRNHWPPWELWAQFWSDGRVIRTIREHKLQYEIEPPEAGWRRQQLKTRIRRWRRSPGPQQSGAGLRLEEQAAADEDEQLVGGRRRQPPTNMFIRQQQHKNLKPVHVSISQQTVNGLLSLLLLFVIATGGCIGSIFIMSALTVIESLQTRGNCYLASMAMSQLLVNLFVIPSSALQIMAGDGGLNGQALCHYQWLTLEFSLIISQLSFALIAADNFLGYCCSERVVTSVANFNERQAVAMDDDERADQLAPLVEWNRPRQVPGSRARGGPARVNAAAFGGAIGAQSRSEPGGERCDSDRGGGGGGDEDDNQHEDERRREEAERSARISMQEDFLAQSAEAASLSRLRRKQMGAADALVPGAARLIKPAATVAAAATANPIRRLFNYSLGSLAGRRLARNARGGARSQRSQSLADTSEGANESLVQASQPAAAARLAVSSPSQRPSASGPTTVAAKCADVVAAATAAATAATSSSPLHIQLAGVGAKGGLARQFALETPGARLEGAGAFSYRFCCGRLRVLLWIVITWALALAYVFHQHERSFNAKFCALSSTHYQPILPAPRRSANLAGQQRPPPAAKQQHFQETQPADPTLAVPASAGRQGGGLPGLDDERPAVANLGRLYRRDYRPAGHQDGGGGDWIDARPDDDRRRSYPIGPLSTRATSLARWEIDESGGWLQRRSRRQADRAVGLANYSGRAFKFAPAAAAANAARAKHVDNVAAARRLDAPQWAPPAAPPEPPARRPDRAEVEGLSAGGRARVGVAQLATQTHGSGLQAAGAAHRRRRHSKEGAPGASLSPDSSARNFARGAAESGDNNGNISASRAPEQSGPVPAAHSSRGGASFASLASSTAAPHLVGAALNETRRGQRFGSDDNNDDIDGYDAPVAGNFIPQVQLMKNSNGASELGAPIAQRRAAQPPPAGLDVETPTRRPGELEREGQIVAQPRASLRRPGPLVWLQRAPLVHQLAPGANLPRRRQRSIASRPTRAPAPAAAGRPASIKPIRRALDASGARGTGAAARSSDSGGGSSSSAARLEARGRVGEAAGGLRGPPTSSEAVAGRVSDGRLAPSLSGNLKRASELAPPAGSNFGAPATDGPSSRAARRVVPIIWPLGAARDAGSCHRNRPAAPGGKRARRALVAPGRVPRARHEERLAANGKQNGKKLALVSRPNDVAGGKNVGHGFTSSNRPARQTSGSSEAGDAALELQLAAAGFAAPGLFTAWKGAAGSASNSSETNGRLMNNDDASAAPASAARPEGPGGGRMQMAPLAGAKRRPTRSGRFYEDEARLSFAAARALEGPVMEGKATTTGAAPPERRATKADSGTPNGRGGRWPVEWAGSVQSRPTRAETRNQSLRNDRRQQPVPEEALANQTKDLFWPMLVGSIVLPSFLSGLLFARAYFKMKEFKMRPYKPMPVATLATTPPGLLAPRSPIPLIAQRQVYTFDWAAGNGGNKAAPAVAAATADNNQRRANQLLGATFGKRKRHCSSAAAAAVAAAAATSAPGQIGADSWAESMLNNGGAQADELAGAANCFNEPAAPSSASASASASATASSSASASTSPSSLELSANGHEEDEEADDGELLARAAQETARRVLEAREILAPKRGGGAANNNKSLHGGHTNAFKRRQAASARLNSKSTVAAAAAAADGQATVELANGSTGKRLAVGANKAAHAQLNHVMSAPANCVSGSPRQQAFTFAQLQPPASCAHTSGTSLGPARAPASFSLAPAPPMKPHATGPSEALSQSPGQAAEAAAHLAARMAASMPDAVEPGRARALVQLHQQTSSFSAPPSATFLVPETSRSQFNGFRAPEQQLQQQPAGDQLYPASCQHQRHSSPMPSLDEHPAVQLSRGQLHARSFHSSTTRAVGELGCAPTTGPEAHFLPAQQDHRAALFAHQALTGGPAPSLLPPGHSDDSFGQQQQQQQQQRTQELTPVPSRRHRSLIERNQSLERHRSLPRALGSPVVAMQQPHPLQRLQSQRPPPNELPQAGGGQESGPQEPHQSPSSVVMSKALASLIRSADHMGVGPTSQLERQEGKNQAQLPAPANSPVVGADGSHQQRRRLSSQGRQGPANGSHQLKRRRRPPNLAHVIPAAQAQSRPLVAPASPMSRAHYSLVPLEQRDLPGASAGKTGGKVILCTYSYMTDNQLLRSNILVFLINSLLWLPFVVLLVVLHYSGEVTSQFKELVWWLAILNCCSCSYLYALSNKDFREAFNKLFYYCCCKSHVTFQKKTPIFRRQLDVDSRGNLRVHIIPGLNVYSNKLFASTPAPMAGTPLAAGQQQQQQQPAPATAAQSSATGGHIHRAQAG